MKNGIDYQMNKEAVKRNRLHFFVAVNPLVPHRIIWLDVEGTRDELFNVAKKAARKYGDDLIIFDGILYQYDHGCGKFIKRRWEDVEYDVKEE